jgi:hypothetical protein
VEPCSDSSGEPLTAFLNRSAPLDGPRAANSLARARRLFTELCVHLPDRQQAGIDPIARLDALEREHPSGLELHARLLEIYATFGDRHTSCFLPAPFGGKLAVLPVRLAEYFENGEPRLAITSGARGGLRPGEVVVGWNDMPIEALVAAHAARQWGAHPAARRAKALQTLTARPLSFLPPPAEERVTLECESGARATFEWRVCDEPAPLGTLEGHVTRQIVTHGKTYGYLRVASFQRKPDELLAEIAGLLALQPKTGLVLDLRGAEDGVIPAGEVLLQLFSERPIAPLGFQFRITEQIRTLARTARALAPFRDAIEAAARNRSAYSDPHSLTARGAANQAGRRYHGPVLVLVDALTFSTAEMLAAGFKDHALALVLGTAPRTGGGGAAAWTDDLVHRLSRDPALAAKPGEARFRVATQRCVRPRGGLIEVAGVAADLLHPPTRADVFGADRDLLARAASILEAHAP